MTSLKGVRNQLLIIHDEGVLNDDELLLLNDLNRSIILNDLDQPYDSFPDFNFSGLKTTSACPNFASTNAACPLAPFSLSCTMK